MLEHYMDLYGMTALVPSPLWIQTEREAENKGVKVYGLDQDLARNESICKMVDNDD